MQKTRKQLIKEAWNNYKSADTETMRVKWYREYIDLCGYRKEKAKTALLSPEELHRLVNQEMRRLIYGEVPKGEDQINPGTTQPQTPEHELDLTEDYFRHD